MVEDKPLSMQGALFRWNFIYVFILFNVVKQEEDMDIFEVQFALKTSSLHKN